MPKATQHESAEAIYGIADIEKVEKSEDNLNINIK